MRQSIHDCVKTRSILIAALLAVMPVSAAFPQSADNANNPEDCIIGQPGCDSNVIVTRGITSSISDSPTPQDTPMPSADAVTPPGDITTPSGIVTTPGTITTPSGVVSTPSGITTTPSGITTTPSGGTTTPSGVVSTPSGITTTPGSVFDRGMGNGSGTR
ncbi:MAG: hypothetical protein HY221_00150 [Candidatus Sungbacteria bacterium]|uniref:Uncharacterized protein n=1 Tax=Candidatus Sungiibacteriota bacterium TaxID=2750080 RepID=A0A932R156_9BACT|nr:hypothetical protein [Candidatus Sungbacteria bacterium]